MKKIMMSAVALTAMMGSMSAVSAADSGVDMKVSGQTVVYYNTLGDNADNNSKDLFDHKANSKANFGIQLNLDADLKNGFTFGSQLNYLGTLGLEKNAVGGTMQNTNGGFAETNIADDIYLSKLYIAKKLDNTTLKLGRQELPKSLSPFAFSEGWNVFKNTFDAILAVNTDIPDTTLVGAYVSKSNHNGFGNNMSNFRDLSVSTVNNGTLNIAGEAYMLTIANKSIPMTAITASYYQVNKVVGGEGASVIWADAAVAGKDLPLGLKVGLQGGQITPETSGLDNTTAYGVKVGMAPVKGLNLCLAYTSVNDGEVKVQNTGGVKTPLYTQMIANQGAIKSDNSTFMLKAAYNTGTYGAVILQGSHSDDYTVGRNLTDIELVYKVKAGGVNFLAAYINQTWSEANSDGVDQQQIARVVARYNF